MKKLTTIILFFLVSASLALQGGPSQPDYAHFVPSGIEDMVNLLDGNFVYQIPLSDIPGPYGNYPLSLSYSAGISPQQEASWVGLGWNLNPGAINRSVRGVPDDQMLGGTLGFMYQFFQSRVSVLDLAYSYGMFSVGQTYSSNEEMNGVSATLGKKIAGIGQVGFTVGSNEVGLTANVGYKYARLNAGLVYSRIDDKPEAYVGGGLGAEGASIGAQVSTGSGASARVGFGNSQAGYDGHVGLTVSSEGVSANGSIGSVLFYGSKKGAGVAVYAGGGTLGVSNSPSSAVTRDGTFGLAFFLPTQIGEFSGAYMQRLHEYTMRSQTIDDVYGYIYQAGPAIDVSDVANFSGLPERESGRNSIVLDNIWLTDRKGRSLEGMGDEELSPAYDMYYVSSEGVRGTFRPFAREKHQLYKKISNRGTVDHDSLESYMPVLEDDTATGWFFSDEFKRDDNGDLMDEVGYEDYAYCRHSSGKCSIYAKSQTNYRNRGNRLVFDSDENRFEERGGMRFLFVGEGGGFYESENVDGSRERSRKDVSDLLLKRKIGDFEYALYGSKKIEPLFEGDSPIGKLRGFVITAANGSKYYFKQPLRSLLEVNYVINREKGTPLFSDRAGKTSEDALLNFAKELQKALNPYVSLEQALKSMFNEKKMEEKCKPDENMKTDDYFFSYTVNMNSYASQWLLTEIQGADYLKLGDDKEIGYTVKFSYTEPSVYQWRTPYARPELEMSEVPNFRVARNAYTPEGCDARLYQASFGIKEYVYLKSIETASHRVDFELNSEERVDGKGWESGEDFLPPILTQVDIGMDIKEKGNVGPNSSVGGTTWKHKIKWRPKYIYVNVDLPKYVLDKLYSGKKIKILGFEHGKYIVTSGSYIFDGLFDEREFVVVPNTFERTTGKDSKNGLYRFEIMSEYEETEITYFYNDLANYVNGLNNGDVLTIGSRGDFSQDRLFVDWSNFFAIDAPYNNGENEMRYLTKISYFNKNDTIAYKEYKFDYDYSLQPKTVNSYCRGRYPRKNAIDDVVKSLDSVGVDVCKIDSTSHSLYGKLSLRSISERGCQNGKCTSLPPFKFSYNTPSASPSRVSYKDGWVDYFQENLAKPDEDDVVNIDDEYFAKFTDLDATILASSNMIDEYGFWSNSANPENHKVDQSFADFGAAAWSLNKVVDPAGGNLEIEYERDRYGAGIDYSQDKRTIDIDDFRECSKYDVVDSKYGSNLCIAVTPLYWREQCLGPRTAYWDSEKPKGFRGDAFAYLDSMDAKKGSNIFFNLVVQLRTKAGCKSGYRKCTRHRSVSVVGDGILEDTVAYGDSMKILVLDRRMEEIYLIGQKATNKINDNKWEFTNGSRSGYAWTGKKLDQVKAGDLRVTRLTRHDIGLKSLTSYEYDAGEIAQLMDSSYTSVLGNRFYSGKISEAIPDVHLNPISRIVGIGDEDLIFLPAPKISYPKVTVKNSSEETSVYNGLIDFFYITPETGVPEEFVDPGTRANLKPFVKVNILYTSMNPDVKKFMGKLYNITLLDINQRVVAGTETKRVFLKPDDRMSLYFYTDSASSAKYIRVEELNSNSPINKKIWSSKSTNESLRTPFSNFNEVSVAIYGGDKGTVNVIWKRSQKKGFFPILYKKCDYDTVQIALKPSITDIDLSTDSLFTIDFESNVTYHDLSAFIGQNYKIVTKRGVGDDASVLMMDSSVYSTVVPDVLDNDISDAEKYKIGRQIEKWSYDLQMQCVDGSGKDDWAGKQSICEKEATDLYIRRLSGANLHKEFAYIRYPVFLIKSLNYVGHDNQSNNSEFNKFGKTGLHYYAYEALTGVPSATLATMDVDEGKTYRKLTNMTPYYMASYVAANNERKYFELSDEMFLRNMLTQNYMEEVYTDTLKNAKDSSWEKLKTNANIRSFSVSPYRMIPDSLLKGASGNMPIIAFGTFQSKALPSIIRPNAMDFVEGILKYEGDSLNYNGSFPSLEEYTGSTIFAIDSKYKVTEVRDVLKRPMSTLFSEDGMSQLSLFFPAKRKEVGAVLAYGDTSYSSANCTELKKTASNGEISIGSSKKNISCSITTDAKNMVMEYRYWTQADGWVTEREIVSPSNAKLEIPANARLNYFRVYPEGSEAKTFVYDKYGNVIQIVAEDNTSTYYEYNPLGFLVQSRNDDGVSFKAFHREYMNDTSMQNGTEK